ncbi:DNA topoisomerase 2-binding protein 1 [Mortierella alpina]|nr:DNA topoisomerase 2-binding protein 1 [Mortierella alpina]
MFRQSNSRKPAAKPPTQKSDTQGASPHLQKPLRGCLVSYTGLSVQEREDVNVKIRAMGGEVSADLTQDITHLIASKVGSEKYMVAFGLGIPVVELAWLYTIHGLWTKGQPVDVQKAASDFSTGPLKGCSVCVTGFVTNERLEIQKKTLQYGGKFTNDLLKGNTTHLVCQRPIGEKYRSAMLWGVKCVKRSWLTDTMKALEVADESKHSFTESDILSAAQSTKPAATANGSNADQARIEEQPVLVPDEMYLEACYIYLCQSFPVCEIPQLKKMIRVAGGIHVTEYDPQGVTHILVPSDKLDDKTLTLLDKDSPLPYIVNQQWLRRSNKEGKILAETDYIVPFPTRTADGQIKPVRFDGATTWTTDSAVALRGLNTKTRGNVAALRTRPKAVLAPDSHNQSPEQCDQDAHEPDVDTSTQNNSASEPVPAYRQTVSAPSVLPSVSTGQSTQERNGLKCRTASGLLTQSLRGLSMEPQAADNSLVTRTDLLNLDEPEESQQSNIFVKLYITTHGCKDSVTEVIRENTPIFGGTYFEETETPPVPDALVRTIVPLSMTWDEAQHQRGVVVTNCWFEASLVEERVISRYDHFLYKPMKTIPIEGFQKLSISVSSTHLQDYEYKQIGRAIKVLGAQYLDKLSTVSTNLLISDQPDGPKYKFMAEHGRPIVTMEWLKQCVEQGVLLPFKDFLLKSSTLEGSKKSTNGTLVQHHPMSRQGSSDSQRTVNSSTSSERSNGQAVPSDKPLSGLAVVLLSRVVGNHTEMQNMIIQMGARLLTTYDSDATHFVHKGKATADAKRDVRQAQRDGLYIVAPSWLYTSRDTGLRANEREHPETYDDKHLTLITTAVHVPRERPPSSVLPRRASSPLRTSSSRSRKSPAAGYGRSGSAFQRQQSAIPSLSQTFQGTAAGATSSMFASESLPSSARMSSANDSFDLSMSGAMDHPYGNNGQLDTSSWQLVPILPPKRHTGERRKRRKTTIAGEDSPSLTSIADTSMTIPTQDEGNDEPINSEQYFKSQERYGEDAVYWVDVEGRERKRALMESVGLKSAAPTPESNSESGRDKSGDVSPEQRPQPHFLLTGINATDRARFKKAITELGGVVLEDISQDQDVWKTKCTHLITNGNKPPRTAKLVLAMGNGSMIVNKGFIAASIEQGVWVDEGPFLVN